MTDDTLIISRNRLAILADLFFMLACARRRGVGGWDTVDYLPPAIAPSNYSLARMDAVAHGFGCTDDHLRSIAATPSAYGMAILLQHIARELPEQREADVRIQNFSNVLDAFGCNDAHDTFLRVSRAIAAAEITEADFHA